jgi:hypothetical protein
LVLLLPIQPSKDIIVAIISKSLVITNNIIDSSQIITAAVLDNNIRSKTYKHLRLLFDPYTAIDIKILLKNIRDTQNSVIESHKCILFFLGNTGLSSHFFGIFLNLASCALFFPIAIIKNRILKLMVCFICDIKCESVKIKYCS